MFEKTIKKYLFNELQFFDESQDEERNALNYFRRSRIHWIYLLNLMSSYYEKKPITKSDLIHKIQISHITILKYIKESIQLNFVEEIKSKRDRRKIILIPQNILIQDFEDFYYEHTREMKQLFDERQEDT
jgi:DNA-binding MarR family transcriptional regulator